MSAAPLHAAIGDQRWELDLDRAGREAAFEEAIVQRVLESALHEDGYSTTVRAVMAAIRPAT